MNPSFDTENEEKQLRWFKSPDNQMTWMFTIPKLVSQILYIKHCEIDYFGGLNFSAGYL